jgi:hypothetical protein
MLNPRAEQINVPDAIRCPLRSKLDCHPREGGDPVRRGFSIQSRLSLEYWVTRLRG